MKIIRKNGVMGLAIFLAVFILFDIFALDLLVKWSIVSAGEAAFKSKTEIKKLHVDIFKSRLTIGGLVVADKNKEFKNVFETGSIVLDFMPSQLFAGKVIVENIEIKDLALGTDRKTSGFLPPAKVKKLVKKDKQNENKVMSAITDKVNEQAKKEISTLPVSKLGNVGDTIKNAKVSDVIKLEDLQSYKKIKETDAKIKEQKDRISAEITNNKIDQETKSIKDSAEKLKSIKVAGPGDIPEAQKGLAELDNIRKQLGSAKTELDTVKADAEGFYSYSKGALEDIKAARDRDVENVMARYNIKILSADGIEKALIVPIWYNRVQQLLDIAGFVNKWILPGKKSKKDGFAAMKRGSGEDILFVADKYPHFLIKNITITTTGSGGNNYYINGKITDITNEQYITGRPTVISLTMSKGAGTMTVNGKLDHIAEANDVININFAGLPASFFGLDGVNYGNVKLESAKMGAGAVITNKPDEIAVIGTVTMDKPVFSAADKEDIVYQAFSSLDGLVITFKLINTGKGATLSMSSDAGDRLKKALAKIYGKKVAEIKAKISKQIDDQVKGEQDKLVKSIASQNSEIKSKIDGYSSKYNSASSTVNGTQNDINGKITKAQNQGATNAVKGLKGLFGK
jgi:uncharacterized protein (TIGR03545 family)